MNWFPRDVSTTGYWIDKLFYLGFWLTLGTFIIVISILAISLANHRKKEGRKAHYTHGNSPQALMLTIGLALAVFFIIDINLAYHDHHAWEAIWGARKHDQNPLKIEIMPEQFAWNIRYAGVDNQFGTEDDITTINDMHVPVNRPVHVALKSKDVIHSFFLPNFRIKQDALPNVVTRLGFEAKEEGRFDIACAEHCGLGHYRMRGIMTVESESAFNEWFLKTGQSGTATPNWGWEWK